MYVGSLTLGFVLVSSRPGPLLQLVVPIMLVMWRCGCSFVLSRKRSTIIGGGREI